MEFEDYDERYFVKKWLQNLFLSDLEKDVKFYVKHFQSSRLQQLFSKESLEDGGDKHEILLYTK